MLGVIISLNAHDLHRVTSNCNWLCAPIRHIGKNRYGRVKTGILTICSYRGQKFRKSTGCQILLCHYLCDMRRDTNGHCAHFFAWKSNGWLNIIIGEIIIHNQRHSSVHGRGHFETISINRHDGHSLGCVCFAQDTDLIIYSRSSFLKHFEQHINLMYFSRETSSRWV